MKKTFALILSLIVVSGTFAHAETPEEARKGHYLEMKKIKDSMRENKKSEISNPSAPSHASEFWKKEGERSGLGNTGNRMGTFFKNLNPAPFFKDQQDRYNSRKTGVSTTAPSAIK